MSTNYVTFLEDTLSRLGNKTVKLVHMDSEFLTKEILECQESKKLHHIIVCRFNNCIKYNLTHKNALMELADSLKTSETTYQANNWNKLG